MLMLTTTPLVAQDRRTEEHRRRVEQYKSDLNRAKAEVQQLQKEKTYN